VGKTHDFHVTTALGIGLEENRDNISASIKHLVHEGREALFDAEHFFDGYKANPDYALSCLHAAYDAGARWIVLCDTNGGTMPDEIATITRAVITSGIPGDHLGIHTHDDTGQAIANALAAVRAGARQVQGTLNGLGERCGNANLITLIPTLMLKAEFSDMVTIGVSAAGLQSLTRLSRTIDDILNRVPQKSLPYVGASAFTHKANGGRAGIEDRRQHIVVFSRAPCPFGHAKGGEGRRCQGGRAIKKRAVGGVGTGPAALDMVNAELIKRLGDADFILGAEINALGLLAVTQGGVVKIEAFRGHGFFPATFPQVDDLQGKS